MQKCCSGTGSNDTKGRLIDAIKQSELSKVNSLLAHCSVGEDDLKNMVTVADNSIAERSTLARTTIEKILLYVCGAIACAYTLNLVAYSLSGVLQQKMFEAHGLEPKHIYPIAVLLITVFGALAAKGWFGPRNRLARAFAIKEALVKKIGNL